jgi:hypothetical protein
MFEVHVLSNMCVFSSCVYILHLVYQFYRYGRYEQEAPRECG